MPFSEKRSLLALTMTNFTMFVAVYPRQDAQRHNKPLPTLNEPTLASLGRALCGQRSHTNSNRDIT